jgi:hypothetical protein
MAHYEFFTHAWRRYEHEAAIPEKVDAFVVHPQDNRVTKRQLFQAVQVADFLVPHMFPKSVLQDPTSGPSPYIDRDVSRYGTDITAVIPVIMRQKYTSKRGQDSVGK